jgi:nucleoside-diphosphate-sugar epimerase
VTASRRALVIGCGYLGLRAGELLVRRGFRVTGTTTRKERFTEIEARGIEPAVLDLERPGDSVVWAAEYEAALHCAAPRGGSARAVFLDGMLEAARRIAFRPGAPRSAFVYASSTGVHPEREGSPVDENSPADPVEERHRVLREAEEMLLGLARSGSLPAIVLRFAGLYGPGRSPVEWLRRDEMRQRILRGRADAFLNWIRIEDAAEAAVLAIERGRPGEVYLISDGSPVRRADFYETAARAGGMEAPLFEGKDDDLGKRCSNAKARKELGFSPRFPSYREGLAALS